MPLYPSYNSGSYESYVNSTETPLAGSATYTGSWEHCGRFSTIAIATLASHAGTLYVDFTSTNGGATQSTITYDVAAGTNEVHRLTIMRNYFRVRFTNGSASAQTSFSIQTRLNHIGTLSAPLNAVIQQDADAQVVRAVPSEVEVAAGRYSGWSLVNKFGKNSDVDTGSTPEDVWEQGGTYTGFPTGSLEEVQVLSSSASDTGVLTFTYLASDTATAYTTTSVTLNGTTPVNTGITPYRIHTARYDSGTSTGFNLGTITVRQVTTTSNIFAVISPGFSQTYSTNYTVPAGSTAYITRFFVRVSGSTSGTVQGALWVRAPGEAPRLRRPFTSTNGDHFEETPYGGITIAEGSDINVRILSSSAVNLDITGGYDIILVKN